MEHGIYAEKLANGDVRYTVNIMVDGKRVHRVIGREGEGATRTQAEQFIETARTDARANRLNLPKGRKLALSFSSAADEYVKKLEESGGENLKIKKRQLRMYLKPFFGGARIDAIPKFRVDQYKKKRTSDGASVATVNRELATLSNFYTKAIEWKWLDRRPCEIQFFEEGQGRIIALSDADCDALMRAAMKSGDPDLWLFVAFGLNTAMRHSEILAARWEYLDLDKYRLFIPEAKRGQREQPITPELAEMLRRERTMRDDCEKGARAVCALDEVHRCVTHGRAGWVFPSPHADAKSGHRVRMDRPFRDAVKAAGLNPEVVTPHVMRHTAVTALVKAGVDLPTIQKISGHKTLAMVLRYTHVHGEHIDTAIKAIGRTLPELPTNEGGNAVTQELHRRRLRPV
jgi:integrase